jgi:periplasmic protein TonB
VSAAYYRDDPWRRLPWLLPLALLLSALALAVFLWFLSGSRFTPPPPPAVQVDVIELPSPPPPPVVEPEPPSPPPPPVVEPEPPPPPAVEEPPPPPPEPAVEPTPEAPPPPPPKPAPRPRLETPRPPTAPPPPTAVAPPPPPPSAAPAGGNTMGPRALYQPKPEIPDELRHHRLDLVAVARFQVAANGNTQVELIEPTPEPSLNRVILETLKKWRFFPALENGRPTAATIDIRIPISVQ